jgi:PAS domain S-box-containing protein
MSFTEDPGHRANRIASRSGLRARIDPLSQLVWLAVAITLVSGGLLALGMFQIREQAIRSGEKLNEALAQVVQEQTTRTIQTIDLKLQIAILGLAQLEAAGKLNQDSAAALLRGHLQNLPYVRAFWVVDANGRDRFDTDNGNTGLDFSDRAYFQVHRNDPDSGFQLSPPVRSRTTGTWLISASRPLRSESGALTGVIVAAVEPHYFDQFWSSMFLASGDSVTLLDRDGRLIVRSPFDEREVAIGPLNMRRVPALANASDAGQFVGTCSDEAQECLFSFRRLSGPAGMVVVVGSSKSQLLAPFGRLSTASVVIWVICSTAVLLLCIFLTRAWRQTLRSEQRLQEMAQRIALATDASGIGIWDWNLKTDQWSATPTYFAILGLAPREGLQASARKLAHLHPDDRAAVAAKMESALASPGEQPFAYEARMLHADGSYRWVSLTGRVLQHDAQGRPSRLLGVLMDITDRKNSERALKNAKEFSENLIENANAMVVGVDRQGMITLFNQASQRVTGFAAEDVLGKSALEMLGMPNRLSPAPDGSRRALDGIGARFHDAAIVTRSGARRQISWQNSAIMEGEQIVGILSFGIDETERRRADAALRESEERYRLLVEASPYAIVLHQDGMLLMANPAAVAMLGAEDEAQLVGRPVATLLHPDEARLATERTKRLLAGELGIYPVEVRYCRLDGSIVPVEASSALLSYRGRPASQTIALDISQRKKAEAALRESNRQLQTLSRRVLEAQETERRRLARELHDELGQSLTSLKISIQSQQRFGHTLTQDTLSEYVAKVDGALQETRRLALALRPSVLDDLGLVPALRWMSEQTAARSDMVVNFRPALAVQMRLAADVETACFRIAQEALTNITRYAQARNVEVALDREEDQLVLTVRDNGVGFDLEAARARAVAGGSLGVLGMQERAMLIGGTLDIRTRPGEGCTVQMRCPWRVAVAP